MLINPFGVKQINQTRITNGVLGQWKIKLVKGSKQLYLFSLTHFFQIKLSALDKV